MATQLVQQSNIASQPVQQSSLASQPVQHSSLANQMVQHSNIAYMVVQKSNIANQPVQHSSLASQPVQQSSQASQLVQQSNKADQIVQHSKSKSSTQKKLKQCDSCTRIISWIVQSVSVNNDRVVYPGETLHNEPILLIKCSACQLEMANFQLLAKHVLMCHYPCVMCSHVILSKDIRKHILSHCPIRYPSNHGVVVCSKCGKKQAGLAGLLKHDQRRDHNFINLRQCFNLPKCQCSYSQNVKCQNRCTCICRKLINQEAKSVSPMYRGYACRNCFKIFDSVVGMQKHCRQCEGVDKDIFRVRQCGEVDREVSIVQLCREVDRDLPRVRLCGEVDRDVSRVRLCGEVNRSTFRIRQCEEVEKDVSRVRQCKVLDRDAPRVRQCKVLDRDAPRARQCKVLDRDAPRARKCAQLYKDLVRVRQYEDVQGSSSSQTERKGQTDDNSTTESDTTGGYEARSERSKSVPFISDIAADGSQISHCAHTAHVLAESKNHTHVKDT